MKKRCDNTGRGGREKKKHGNFTLVPDRHISVEFFLIERPPATTFKY